MSILVRRAGMLSTLQDLGRRGYQKYGVLASGAMDEEALRLGNILVGNEQSEAALEMTIVGPVLEFSEDVLVALTGGDISPTIDGVPVPMWRPVLIKEGSTLRFGRTATGCRAYLCVSGGYDVPVVMGSKSTYLRAGIGGFKGRAIAAEDVMAIGAKPENYHKVLTSLQDGERYATVPWYVLPSYTYSKQEPIRIMEGLQYEYFTEETRQHLVSKEFQITVNADRMGYRLEGCTLSLTSPLEMISEAALQGTIQVPSDGNPIILMSDRQSVAGYPKIAQVVMADMGRLAQCRAGERIQFSLISEAEAEQLFLQRERYIEEVANSVSYRFE